MKGNITSRLVSSLLAMCIVLALLPTMARADGTDAEFKAAVNGVVALEAPTTGAATDWQKYLNSRFYNAVGGSAEAWSPKWDTANTAAKWSGDAATVATDAASADVAGNLAYQPYSDNAMVVTTYYVWSGEQLRYALKQCVSADGYVKLMADIDLNGQGGKLWSGVNLGANSVTIDGNGHTIYNLCSIGETTGAGLINNATGEFAMKNLSFVRANLCGKANNGEGAYTKGAAIVNRASSSNIIFEDVDLADCLFAGSFYVGGIVGRFDGAAGTETTKYFKNCSVENSVSFGENHVGSLAGPVVSVNHVRNCYSVGCTVISTGGHSGGLFSCGGTITSIENCFVDAEVYGTEKTGVFSGALNGACKVTSCYSSGFVEGSKKLGGFVGEIEIGSTNVIFNRCYSTALVGLRSAGNWLGGFAGSCYSATGATMFLTDCYAAGEVGSIDTDADMDGITENSGAIFYKTRYANAGSHYNDATDMVGGMIGLARRLNSDTTFVNCYYDKQTTAMKEWGVGSLNGYFSGLKGVLTTATSKSGTGLMDTPADPTDPASKGFVGFSNNAPWDFTAEDHYPELKVFSEADEAEWGDARKAALARAYSKSSTAGVQLETWDYGLNEDTGKLYTEVSGGTGHELADTTYDTVRDIVNGFLLTSNTVSRWDRIGAADSADTVGQKAVIAGTEQDVLSLKHQNGQWLCDELTTGIEWLRVSLERSGDRADLHGRRGKRTGRLHQESEPRVLGNYDNQHI